MKNNASSLIILKKSDSWKEPLSYRIELRLFTGEIPPPVYFVRK